MQYKYLSTEEQQESVAAAIREREKEHYNYELNRQNYIRILDSLSSLPDWPENLKPYKNVVGEQLVQALSGDDLTMVTQLQYRDRVRILMATTEVEQAKSEKVYEALSSQITDEECTAALSRIDAKGA